MARVVRFSAPREASVVAAWTHNCVTESNLRRLSADALVRPRSGYPTSWTDGMTVSGRSLEAVGLPGPMLYPDQALLFHLVAGQDDGR